MTELENEDLKARVRDFWNAQSCDTQVARSAKFSKEYFEEIERFRYVDQPFIHSFAQFTRYRGKKVLEVGFGAGTDFMQWLRAGAHASGMDLTEEALANLRHRMAIYESPEPERIQVADAERLPFESNLFDLGYSFGVLHHSPNTARAIAELARVVAPGGEIKLMLYNRHSVYAVNLWVKHALLKGQPWRSLRWVLWRHMESIGTQGFTRSELLSLLSACGLREIDLVTHVTAADYLSAAAFPPLNIVYRLMLRLSGCRYAWHPSQYAPRVHDPDPRHTAPSYRRDPLKPRVMGNALGFFHCVSARKAPVES
jgi:SAM-dependent methyltransferase